MRRLVVLGSAVLAAAAMLAPQASANHTLAHKVRNLQEKVNCLVRYGLSEWDGYAPYVGGDGTYAFDPGTSDIAANLDLAFGDTSPPHVWVLATRNTAACRAKFPRGANPFSFTATARVIPTHLTKLRT